jgi:TetR/AcrR family transcriptional repressor of nem operon
MARPKEFDPEIALATAMERFWERGFEATSLADITAATGVQKASLYATYGDKRKLFLTALTRYQDEGIERLAAALAVPGPVRAAIEALFQNVVRDCTTRDGARGCLCVNTAVELGPRDPEIARMLELHAARAEKLIADALDRGKASGEFSASLRSPAVARHPVHALRSHRLRKGCVRAEEAKDRSRPRCRFSIANERTLGLRVVGVRRGSRAESCRCRSA